MFLIVQTGEAVDNIKGCAEINQQNTNTIMARLPLAFFFTALFLSSGNAYSRQIAGWVERVRLGPAGIELKAKLDTGAENSSVNTSEPEFFVREGREHVRFKVKNKAGDVVELTRPVIRYAGIKRHFGKSQKRPVVLLKICVGNLSKEVEVNLVDRSGFNYPLLIGRSYLAGDILVDSADTYRLAPRCGEGVPR